MAAQGCREAGHVLPGLRAVRGRWTFTPSVHAATRQPPLPDPAQLEPLRDMLAEISQSTGTVERFVRDDWPDLLARRNDPDAEYCGNSVCFRVSGEEVILTPLYDQWDDDAAFVYVPLADVQDMIDQFVAYARTLPPWPT